MDLVCKECLDQGIISWWDGNSCGTCLGQNWTWATITVIERDGIAVVESTEIAVTP